jgi:hypothetical protein
VTPFQNAAMPVDVSSSVKLHLNALHAHSKDPHVVAVPTDVCMALANDMSTLDASRVRGVNEWIRATIVYLEDTVIRHFSVEDRHGLKSTDESVWFDSVRRYVHGELGCPVACVEGSVGGSHLVVSPGALVWTLGHAVGLAYDDDECGDEGAADRNGTGGDDRPRSYDDVMTRDVIHSGVRLEADEGDAIDECLIWSDDALEGTSAAAFDRVCEALAVHRGHTGQDETTDPDKNSSDVASISAGDVERCIYRIEHEMLPFLAGKKTGLSLDDEEAIRRAIPLGFSTGDDGVDMAARVLRILHIKELRRLQNAIDDAIAAHQNVTANPRTDTTQKKKKKQAKS